MRKNLPSLSALYAFEATARHLSFSRAAIELNLTQAIAIEPGDGVVIGNVVPVLRRNSTRWLT